MAELSTGEKLALGGGSFVILGALLPWTGPGLFEGIGLGGGLEIVTLMLGIVLLGLIYVADWTETAQLLVILIGVVVTGMAAYTLAETLGLVGTMPEPLSASLGLYVTLFAGLVVLAGGAQSYRDTTPEAGMYSHR